MLCSVRWKWKLMEYLAIFWQKYEHLDIHLRTQKDYGEVD